MSRTKKLKLLAKATKTTYRPTARDAAAYERVTQFVMQQARMAHEAGFAKGMGLDTAETMRLMVVEGNEARRLLATLLEVHAVENPEHKAAQEGARAFLDKPPSRMVPKPVPPTVALVPQSDSAPTALPSTPSDAVVASLPDAAPSGEAPAVPPQ